MTYSEKNDLSSCGALQGRFCLYKLSDGETEDWDEAADMGHLRVNRGIPPNNPVQVLIRVYVVSVSLVLFWASVLDDKQLHVFSVTSVSCPGIEPAPS